MKLGDMSSEQIVEKICRGQTCDECEFYDPDTFNACSLTSVDPSVLNLNIEVNIDAEDQN